MGEEITLFIALPGDTIIVSIIWSVLLSITSIALCVVIILQTMRIFDHTYAEQRLIMPTVVGEPLDTPGEDTKYVTYVKDVDPNEEINEYDSIKAHVTKME